MLQILIDNKFLKTNEIKIESTLYGFKFYKYGIKAYEYINNYYIVLNKDRDVVLDFRVGDLDTEKSLEYSDFNENWYQTLSTYLKGRILEPFHIKQKALFFVMII